MAALGINMIKTVVSILFLFLTPLLAATRLVFVAKYLRVAKEGIFTVLAYLASAIVLVTVLFWFGQIHTTYYGPAGAGGWGFLLAIPALLISAVFLELMVLGSKRVA
jgi:hypothetical protein